MTRGVYVDRTRTRVVPEGSPEAAFRIHLDDARRLGIDVDEMPSDKQAKRPFDKMRRVRADKGSAT